MVAPAVVVLNAADIVTVVMSVVIAFTEAAIVFADPHCSCKFASAMTAPARLYDDVP